MYTYHERERARQEVDIPQELFHQAVQYSLDYISKHYRYPADPRQVLDYHGPAHTTEVVSRTQRILETIRQQDPALISQRDIQRGVLGAVFHDIVQQWESVPSLQDEVMVIMRKGKPGFNEKASRYMALQYMHEVNDQYGREIFSDEDCDIVGKGILLTIPGYDMHLKTVIQPGLTADTGLVEGALALADLGGAGMDGPDAYATEGNRLFLELNMDVRAILFEGRTMSSLQKDLFRKRLLAWGTGQIDFAAGRVARLERELAFIPEHIRPAIVALFAKGEETVAKSKELYSKRLDMSTNELREELEKVMS
ncbi:MAG: hypothetical protein UZ21_OP11001000467 [Microgenomates bacterium OLB22]|nr:MAG: hypothetical protein UZ21_OP11001000467 [Microgenomates bacterium OLB22]